MPKPHPALFGTLALAFLFTLGVCGRIDAQSGDARPCPRKTPRSFAPGSVTLVKDEKPPCRIVFRAAGVRLDADPDGTRPDPGNLVVRDSRGRFYSANSPGWHPAISVWNPNGEYVTSFGRGGEGPGELSGRGRLNVFVDGGDRLHVRDGAFNWSVFSPDHEFLWRVPAHVMRGLLPQTVILDNGMALTAVDGYMSDRTRHFHLVDSAGALDRAFGPVERELSLSESSLLRTLAYGGGETFWAGPAQGDSRGYLLEEWGIDGTLRRALLREAAWFDPRDEEGRVAVEHLHIDDGGLLYVIVVRATDGFAEAVERARREGRRLSREERSAITEAVIEMIDTRTGELLASEAHPVSSARTSIPTQLFRGLKQGAVYKEEPGGLPFVDIVSVELEAR